MYLYVPTYTTLHQHVQCMYATTRYYSIPFLLFVCIRKHSATQTHLVLMSFTSELLLFIKHATKSVGSALPIRNVLALFLHLCINIVFFLLYFHEIYLVPIRYINAGRKEYLLANISEL